jgi:iron(III) transport system substrate-binding protein
VPDVRTRLPSRFKERFGIEVEYLSSGSELATRLRNERASELYTVDVVIGGPSTIPLVMFPEGMFDPIRPILVIPDVDDGARWVKGKPWYFDPEERYLIRLVDKISHAFTVNASYVDPAQLATPHDLLDPRWKGRIAGGDYARSAGSGMSKSLLILKVLGEDFLRDFYLGQDVKVTADERLLSDWVGHGTYPIVVGMADTDQFKLRADGVNVLSLKMRHKAQAERNAGAGIMGLINRAPNPNSAKLFVNWMMTQEGMQVFSAAARVPVTRTDVDYGNVDPDILPERGFDYLDMSDWDLIVHEQVPLQRRVSAILGGAR